MKRYIFILTTLSIICILIIPQQTLAQEVLTKTTDGGASWLTGSGGIYSGDGETPEDVDVTVTDNIDFDAGTLFIDGSNNRIGIGTDEPNSSLHIEGSMSTAARIVPTGSAGPVAVDVTTNDHTLIFSAPSGYTSITLPSASDCNGRIYYLLNRSSTTITGVTTYITHSGTSNELPPNVTRILQAINNSWYQIN